ncbi:efflux RND transporter periplasmic adaptor subunit [Paraburkholderia caballeronis]|uniref:RND family efflux transporter, MFP subunit n=1 Tax=Paraburkholderia caballeronis TaxID=416943 RepID=A0A1H7L6D9_9BURK|nr:efflux RND transporter periplasmic adaptor subunit [Paraburkholderia caballeronis]PXW28314.1 RND family efflux transporter MFP subunit [Paraburkholderia caballeronis]PXX03680.1 RND family efflux transporter MFP subunit [Paraburkholderia caballeronis]RAK04424.1 RND family efflux transporter MFP subunit [Paraburkholderia caballeronis]SED80748.1 RND family efflux transporter, MFP subunit [Paraburkholderia caballeronis]SEK94562.1 RND family efflux transporter, MFP subunit [Paraburkholderia caba
MSSEPVQTYYVRRPARSRTLLALIVGFMGIAIVVISCFLVRASESRKLNEWTDKQAIPTVTEIAPARASGGPILTLPSRLEAYSRAPIFARVPGYLKSWNVDIGATVKAGQLMGMIETPELDQQLMQARADLASARASERLAALTANRWQAMAGTDAVAQQDVDERTSDWTAKKAVVAAAAANVDRLVALKGFARIVAPFDGVVTARMTDIGALINAGNGGAGSELFEVSDVRQLRVYARVPQNYARQISDGTTATLTVPEYAGKTFSARVVAQAGAVDSGSGTTLVQLFVDNRDEKLMPGGYASLQFGLPQSATGVRIPASALVFDERGLQVAVIGRDDKVFFRRVSIARDFGDSVEIASGLRTSDRVIDTPPDGLAQGDAVHIAKAIAREGSHE